MKTELKHVLANLKEYSLWNIQSYPLSKAEAEVLIEAFERLSQEETHEKPSEQ